MRRRVHLNTLGDEDLGRARGFYEALGWRAAEAPEAIVVFDLWGASLALYPRVDLGRDMGRELAHGSGAVTLACNVRQREEVAAVLDAARAAGAEVVREAFDAEWGGRVGYFADFDGHAWEVAWNPGAPLGANDEFQGGGA